MENYREQLRHIVRPEDPQERREADSTMLTDYEALYLRRGLTEYAAYGADSEEEEQIALGYVEYIDMVVRDEERRDLNLYAHTDEAKAVLKAALSNVSRERDMHGMVEMMIEDLAD